MSSKTSGRRATGIRIAADELGRSLEQLVRLGASRRLHQRQALAASVNVSQPGLRLLRMLVEKGPASPGDLARWTDMDPAVVTRQSQQLESDGFIQRARDDRDARLSSLAATEGGIRAFHRMRKVLNRHLQVALASWDPSDVETLAGLIARLVADLQAIPYPDLPPGGRR